MHIGKEIEFFEIGEVLQAARYAIQQNMDTLNEGVEDLNTAEEELQEHMNIFLYLIVIFTKIKKSNSSNERFEAMKTIYQVRVLPIWTAPDGISLRSALILVLIRMSLMH